MTIRVYPRLPVLKGYCLKYGMLEVIDKYVDPYTKEIDPNTPEDLKHDLEVFYKSIGKPGDR